MRWNREWGKLSRVRIIMWSGEHAYWWWMLRGNAEAPTTQECRSSPSAASCKKSTVHFKQSTFFSEWVFYFLKSFIFIVRNAFEHLISSNIHIISFSITPWIVEQFIIKVVRKGHFIVLLDNWYAFALHRVKNIIWLNYFSIAWSPSRDCALENTLLSTVAHCQGRSLPPKTLLPLKPTH